MQTEGETTLNSTFEISISDQDLGKNLLDLSVMDKYYGGSDNPEAIKIFRGCAIRMLESLDRRLSLLRSSIENGNAKEAMYYAHQLRGSFNAMGSYLLATYCKKIENKAINNDLSDCSEIEKTISYLSKLFSNELWQLVGTEKPSNKQI